MTSVLRSEGLIQQASTTLIPGCPNAGAFWKRLAYEDKNL